MRNKIKKADKRICLQIVLSTYKTDIDKCVSVGGIIRHTERDSYLPTTHFKHLLCVVGNTDCGQQSPEMSMAYL